MKYTIDSIENMRILIVSFTGSTPHLETSLEIARRLSKDNQVSYIHLGRHVSRPTLFPSNFIKRKFQLAKRVTRAKRYLKKYSTKETYINWIEANQLNAEVNQTISQLCHEVKKPEIINIEILINLK